MKQSHSVPKIWSLCNCASKLFAESLLHNKTTKNDMILVNFESTYLFFFFLFLFSGNKLVFQLENYANALFKI